MAKQCDLCGKATSVGRQVSHAHNVTSRPVLPNLKRLRAWIDGTPRRIWACTRCIRSGKVQRVPVRVRPRPVS